MPGRKRENPQRLDSESAAKRQELFQFVPKTKENPPTAVGKTASADSACLPQPDHSLSLPLMEIGNSSGDLGGTATQDTLVCTTDETPGISREPLPISSCYACPIALQHSKMPVTKTNIAARILAGKTNPSSSSRRVPVMFGRLNLKLKSPCPDVKRLLGDDCTQGVRAFLISPVKYDDVVYHYLKVKDWENVYYCEVEMDYRMETAEGRKVFKYFFSGFQDNYVKAFLTYECHGNEEDPVVILELWAMEKCCVSDDHLEAPQNANFRKHSYSFVELLYPEMFAQHQEKLMAEAVYTLYYANPLSVVGKIEKFYKDVQMKRRECPSQRMTLDVASVPGLTAELRGYQRRGVEWMLEKEGKVSDEVAKRREEVDGPRPLHMLWEELPTIEHGLPHSVYFNTHSGKFATRRFAQPPWPRGGILADEMGLGKTVEVLALLMLHKWPGPDSRENEKATNQIDDMEVHVETKAIESDQTEAGTVGVAETKEVGVAGVETGVVGVVDTPTVGVAPNGVKDAAADVVKCICGAMKDNEGVEFVQCERCLVWQHSRCVRFDSTKDSSFVCVKCLIKEPMPCGTTLIVSPQSIAQQWLEEIEKHTEPGALKVMLYEGIKRCTGYISPSQLASYDIVLVTYETLRDEFYHATSHEVSWNLRRRKRYVCYPSPLPAVYWWRLCLDEAQMVESTHTKAAEMMMELTAVNRWCVTGTPVQRSLLDLHGLVLFLGVEPYSSLPWFRRLVWDPYREGRETAMISLFSKIMWRSSKEDVVKELNLPKQTEEIHWLNFSAVERYFYRRQQETCAREVKDVVAHESATLSSLFQSTVMKLMHSLHSLRQACCHPSIVRTSYLPVNIGDKNCMTMPALLKKLTQHTKALTRDDLRMQVSALNGLAGLHILKEEFPTAIEIYRSAMAAWQEQKSHDVECDRVLRIHTMENLAEILAQGHGGNARTLRDDSLLSEAKELRSEFMKRSRGQVIAAEEAFLVCKKNVEDTKYESDKKQAKFLGELPKELEKEEEEERNEEDEKDDSVEVPSSEENEQSMDESGQSGDIQDSAGTTQPGAGKEMKRTSIFPSQYWWMSVAEWAAEHKLSPNLLEHVNSDDHYQSLRFNDVEGIVFKLCLYVDRMDLSRDVVLSGLDALMEPPSAELIEQAGNCHIHPTCPEDWDQSECRLCSVENDTAAYECLLFSRYQHYANEIIPSHHSDGSRGISDFERIVKAIVSFIRFKGAPHHLVKSGQAFLGYLESLKKEYKAMRKLWMALHEHFSDCDELSQAARRRRLMSLIEAVMDMECDDPFAVHPLLLEMQITQSRSDLQDAKTSLNKHIGQLVYLQNLAESPEQKGENKDPCLICTSNLGKEWGVFTCGHPFCVDCIVTLIQRNPTSYTGRVTVKCPLCREPSLSTEISYIKSAPEDNTDSDGVKGSHSAKVIAVVQTLIDIQRNDPGAKALVFSTWKEVLNMIGQALQDNNIDHRVLVSDHKKFQANLTEFKSSKEVNVLLLPFHSGSKGLNIIEATHVLLVEPLLNVSTEQQAIGRVHRIGQTKPTFVHRFFVENTVEEKVHKLLASHPEGAGLVVNNECDSVLTVADIRSLVEL